MQATNRRISRVLTLCGPMAILLCGSAALPTWAQYAPGMDGRATDASNLLGSGGYNATTTPTYFNTANLYVTGNVSRGAYFRGNSPIRDANSLFLSLPSSGIGDFQRDAISVTDVLSDASFWRPSPYYNPSRTVLNVGAIQAGQNLPGSSVPATTRLLPVPYQAASPGTAPVDLSHGTQPLGTVVPNSSIYTPENMPALRGTDLYDRLRLTNQIEALRESPVFGRTQISTTPLAPDALNQPATLIDPYALDVAAGSSGRLDPIARHSRTADPALAQGGSPLRTPDLRNPGALAPRLIPLSQPVGAGDQPREDAGESAAVADDSSLGLVTTEAYRPLVAEDATTLAADQDAAAQQSPYTGANPLIDLNNAFAFVQQYRQEAAGEPESIPGVPSQRARYEQAMSIVRRAADTDVSTLAGTGNSRFDRLMRDAETKVREGDYYQASTLYGLAAALDPTNPLVRLGYAHSLIAAGEYITAVLQLEQAIAEYPAFGFLRLDLNEFVREPKDLDLRRADLEARLERREDYRLRFLLGYIENYSGFAKFGRPNLERSAQAAPAGSVIAQFPEILASPEKYLEPAEPKTPGE